MTAQPKISGVRSSNSSQQSPSPRAMYLTVEETCPCGAAFAATGEGDLAVGTLRMRHHEWRETHAGHTAPVPVVKFDPETEAGLVRMISRRIDASIRDALLHPPLLVQPAPPPPLPAWMTGERSGPTTTVQWDPSVINQVELETPARDPSGTVSTINISASQSMGVRDAALEAKNRDPRPESARKILEKANRKRRKNG